MGNSSSSTSFDYDADLMNSKSKLQSIKTNKENDNRSNIYRSNDAKDNLINTLGTVDTLWAAFEKGLSIAKDREFLASRVYKLDANGKYIRGPEKNALPERGDYKSLTYGQVDPMIRNFGAGLAKLGVQAGESVAIYSINRAEWTISSIGNFSQSFRTVALYDTLGVDAAEYIVNHADCKVLVCSKDKVGKTLSFISKCPTVKFMVQFDVDENIQSVEETLDESDVKKADELGVKLISFSALLKLGSESGIFPNPPKPDDLAFIMYTSGTTGMPKGAMLTHKNVISATGGALKVFPILETDVHVSYLPLAHIFETNLQAGCMSSGAKICYYQADPRKIPDDFAAAKVTVLAGVPRVFEKIYDRFMKVVSTSDCAKKFFVSNAYQSGCEANRRGEEFSSFFLGKVREAIGLSNVRVVVSGAAPLPGYLAEFCAVVIGVPVCQGYGMTENAAGCTIGLVGDHHVGHVGPPTACAEICLEDVPDMNYFHTDKVTLADGKEVVCPRGEILVRGPSVFRGYFKNEVATSECLEPSGWLHTGDIGRINPNGSISIIDRKKNLLKLSQGEYIALEKVEAGYKNTWCNQLWVYGNSYHSKLLAVVVPAAENVVPWLVEKGWWPSGMPFKPTSEFVAEFKVQCEAHYADIKKEILKLMEAAAKANNIKGFEKVHDIHMECDLDLMMLGFTVDNDMVTPTQKYKRNNLMRRYETQLRQLYVDVQDPCKENEKW